MSDSFEDFMVTLRQEFMERLPEQSILLAQAWHEAVTGENLKRALRRLEGCAHQLAGSGDIFGCPAIATAAEAFEIRLIATRCGVTVPLEEIARLMEDLNAAIMEARPQPD